MRTAIELRSLSKRYRIGETRGRKSLRETLGDVLRRGGARGGDHDVVWAVKDVTLTIEEDEVVGLIGRNGAGKTTLLKLLSRITYPTSGDLRVRGRVASLVEVGTGFHQELTGRENVYLNGSILGLRKREIDERFESIVEFSGVRPFLDTPVKRYSTGMRLRLGFAVAAHLSPNVLLVDEILSVGDYDFQQRCLAALDDVRESSRTVVFVSHNLEAVEQLCPRTIWIDRGAVRMDGPSREVISAYLASASRADESAVRFEEDPTGTGDVRFTGLEFLTAAGQPADAVRAGDGLVVRLHYDVRNASANPHFGVRIYTDLGALVADTNTYLTGFEIPRLDEGTGSLDLHIEQLNLVPGRYFVSIWAQRLGERNVYDARDHCAVMDVQAANVFGAGRPLSRKYGVVYFPCSWSHP